MRADRCQFCNRMIEQPSTGRPRMFCSGTCRNRNYVTRCWGVQHWEIGDECGWCHEPLLETDTIELDHIIAVARGGASIPPNLRWVHGRCNRSKGASFVSDETPGAVVVPEEPPSPAPATAAGDSGPPCIGCEEGKQEFARAFKRWARGRSDA